MDSVSYPGDICRVRETPEWVVNLRLTDQISLRQFDCAWVRESSTGVAPEPNLAAVVGGYNPGSFVAKQKAPANLTGPVRETAK